MCEGGLRAIGVGGRSGEESGGKGALITGLLLRGSCTMSDDVVGKAEFGGSAFAAMHVVLSAFSCSLWAMRKSSTHICWRLVSSQDVLMMVVSSAYPILGMLCGNWGVLQLYPAVWVG